MMKKNQNTDALIWLNQTWTKNALFKKKVLSVWWSVEAF